jgi:FkbM family methyltransferase
MLDHNYLYYKGLEENDVVLILGATHGDFIREYKNEILQKNVFVINVEPTLEGIASLATYIKSNMPENACVLSCALSNYSTIEPMEIRGNLITSTLENRPETNERWPMPLLYKTKVPVFTLDEVIMMADKVDKIFCDIEGSELEVFGYSNLIKDVPYLAIAAYHLRNNQETHNDLVSMFYQTHKVSVTGEASLRKNEVVFFAMKEG